MVRLSWIDNSSMETGYRIDVNDAPFGSTPTVLNVIEVQADSTGYVYETWPGRTLYFRVLAITAELESDPSNVVSLTTPDVPLAPSWLTASAVSPSRIDLSWQDVAGETGYRVERSGAGGTSWKTIAELGADSTGYSDNGLAPDTEYWYRVYARNADGESAPSNAAAAVTQTVSVQIVTASSAGDVGYWVSLGLSGGYEYVSHYDAGSGRCLLTYGYSSYATVSVDSGPTGHELIGATGTSLAVDGSGYVHVAAQDWTNGDLRYITNRPGPAFSAVSIDAAGSVGWGPKIAISPADGKVHILYLENLPGPDQLKHAVLGTGGWTFETIMPSAAYVSSFSLAIDHSGVLHAAVSRSSDGGVYELVHAMKSGVSWGFTGITSSDQPSDNSIAIDALGFPHIAFYGGGSRHRLMHATNASGVWFVEVVHESPGGDVGRYNSIAIDPSTGRIHIAYYDAGGLDLRYARKDPGGGWALRLLDTEGDVGRHASIAVDQSGIVHVAYRDETNGDLKVARGVP